MSRHALPVSGENATRARGEGPAAAVTARASPCGTLAMARGEGLEAGGASVSPGSPARERHGSLLYLCPFISRQARNRVTPCIPRQLMGSTPTSYLSTQYGAPPPPCMCARTHYTVLAAGNSPSSAAQRRSTDVPGLATNSRGATEFGIDDNVQ
jgi:hypothetical protein